MKTIIAATDFSPASLNAVNYAADMAVSVNADLLILNVYNIPVVYMDGPVIAMPVEELMEGSERDLEKVRTDVLTRVGWKIKVNTKSRMGNVTEELKDLCNSTRPFAVVIGARGKSNFEKTVFGSSALSIIKHLTWPVLCIPPGKAYGKGITKIGFACDFRQVTETTPQQFIRQFIEQFDAELHILNVDHNDKHFTPDTPYELESLYHMFEKESPQYHFIDNEDIEDGIIEFAKENKLDLLITVPHKHTILEKIFKPSSTKQLIAGSQIPVLCVHE